MPPRTATTTIPPAATPVEAPPPETAPAAIPPAEPEAGTVLRKGAPPPAETVKRKASELVRVRIAKSGHGLVHDGKGGAYNWQDEVMLPYSVALAQEANKNVEIIG